MPPVPLADCRLLLCLYLNSAAATETQKRTDISTLTESLFQLFQPQNLDFLKNISECWSMTPFVCDGNEDCPMRGGIRENL